jgi:hypothetical protein
VEKSFFALWFRLYRKDGYLLWIGDDDQDSVFVDEDRLIPVFRSESALALYARARNIEIVNEEPILHDLDLVKAWLRQPDQPIDSRAVLAAWNLFTDVGNGIEMAFTGRQRDKLTRRIYDKLFFGNNLPGVTPPNEYYIPQWSAAERVRLVSVITQGLQLFERNSKEMENK